MMDILSRMAGGTLKPGAGTVKQPMPNIDPVARSINQAAVAANAMYPDRPMKPLPKRRLRERLSPQAADELDNPLVPDRSPPLFSLPYNLKTRDNEALREDGFGTSPPAYSQDQVLQRSIREFQGDDLDTNGANGASGRFVDSQGRSTRRANNVDKYGHPQTPPSVTSSADGYDSFENTNNKKKRKIPSAGDMNGSAGLNDAHAVPGSLATPVTPGDRNGELVKEAYAAARASGSPFNGMSGPGRGRYGRSKNARSPLQLAGENVGNMAGRNGKTRPTQWSPDPAVQHNGTGIISNAIANAEKYPLSSGQENGSLLPNTPQQRTPIKSSPASATQFTFTCDSQVPGSLTWPDSPTMTSHPPQPGASSQAPRAPDAYPPVPAGNAPPHNAANVPQAPEQTPLSPKALKRQKRAQRRAMERELARQAMLRQDEATKRLALSGKTLDDMDKDYTCDFCIYESIFRRKPVHLIRSFEKKAYDLKRVEEQRLRDRARKQNKAQNKRNKNTKAAAANTTKNGDKAVNFVPDQPPDLDTNDPDTGYGCLHDHEEGHEHTDQCEGLHMCSGATTQDDAGNYFHSDGTPCPSDPDTVNKNS